MPFPALVDVTDYAQGSSTNPHPVTLPASIVAGQRLVMVLTKGNGAFGNDPGLSASGWTQLDGDGSDNGSLTILTRLADGTEGSTVSVSHSGGSCQLLARTWRFNDGGLPSADAVGAFSDTANPDPPSLSLGSTLDGFAIAAVSAANCNVTAIPSGFTDSNTVFADVLRLFDARDVEFTGATLNPSTFTISTARTPTVATIFVPYEKSAFAFIGFGVPIGIG